MVDPKKPTPRRLNLEVPSSLAATYANFAIITHSPYEVFLDFAQILPNTPKARVQARLVLSPTNAKMLLKALEENVARYEAQHGEIKLPQRATSLADQLFSTIRGGEEEDEGGEGGEGDDADNDDSTDDADDE
jgi:hypothetical protein